MEQHSPDIYGSVQLAGSAGVVGQLLGSNGPGIQASWQNISPTITQFPSTVLPQGNPAAWIVWNKPSNIINRVNNLTKPL